MPQHYAFSSIRQDSIHALFYSFSPCLYLGYPLPCMLIFKLTLFVVCFWSCVCVFLVVCSLWAPDSELLRTSNACLFCNKTFKNLFPCNLRPFAIEITLAIFRHSPSCIHNNWIVTVDEMGCEVTSCKLNSPTPPHPHPPCRPPSSQNVILLRLVYPDVCQPSREEMFCYICGTFLSDARPSSFRA